jgi:hypothetical protein
MASATLRSTLGAPLALPTIAPVSAYMLLGWAQPPAANDAMTASAANRVLFMKHLSTTAARR